MASAKLTTKEFKFAEAIIAGLSKIKAAEEAGAPPTAATALAVRMFQKESVVRYIEARRSELQELRRKTIEVDDLWLTQQFKEIYSRCMQGQRVMRYDRELGQLVHETDENGDGLWTFDSSGAIRALENIGKHIGYFEMDNKQRAPVIRVSISQNSIHNNFIIDNGDNVDGQQQQLTEGGD